MHTYSLVVVVAAAAAATAKNTTQQRESTQNLQLLDVYIVMTLIIRDFFFLLRRSKPAATADKRVVVNTLNIELKKINTRKNETSLKKKCEKDFWRRRRRQQQQHSVHPSLHSFGSRKYPCDVYERKLTARIIVRRTIRCMQYGMSLRIIWHLESVYNAILSPMEFL